MGKDKSEKSSSKKEKKESKRSETDGVKKSSKKDKKTKLSEDNVAAAYEEAVKQNGGSKTEVKEVVVVKDGEVESAITVRRPVGALVPFAAPLADEKVGKKVLKSVKKAAKNKTLKRGVKEVVKALRKRPAGLPTDSTPGVVILAADISPMDVISHIPVLCEDHNIPYIFVVSRAELGAAGNTKRPTSVVMVSKERSGKKTEKIEGEEEYKEVFDDLVKVVQKEGRSVKV